MPIDDGTTTKAAEALRIAQERARQAGMNV
jgi:hypothetical protein